MTKREILGWEVATWLRALFFWEQAIREKNMVLKNGLEIGAHGGGLSLFFAKKFGSKMLCTDLEPVLQKAQMLHQKHGVQHLVEYAQADATALLYPDATFDFVVFKSVLGGIGRNQTWGKQEQAIQEIHRVLRPGGVLFFAENLRGSALHRMARQKFVPWGSTWQYVSLQDLEDWLSVFEQKEIRATGFLAAFARRPGWLNYLAAGVDKLLFFIPDHARYLAYGLAVKSTQQVHLS